MKSSKTSFVWPPKNWGKWQKVAGDLKIEGHLTYDSGSRTISKVSEIWPVMAGDRSIQ